MLKIGLFPNVAKPAAPKLLQDILDYFKMVNIETFLLKETAQKFGLNNHNASCVIINEMSEIKNKIDMAITIGGDGILLSTAREVVPVGVPICGINLGKVGFLTEIEPAELETKLEKIIRGDYIIEERIMLDAAIFRDGKAVCEAVSLNDVVVAKGGFSRMINLNLFIAGEFTARYPADGLIIATSTGSTGYSLSSGGPIIHPELEVVAITPICPHTLLSRALIIPAREEIKIKPQTPHGEIILTIDGQKIYDILPEDSVVIKKSRFNAKFLLFSEKSYYKNLRDRLYRCNIGEINKG